MRTNNPASPGDDELLLEVVYDALGRRVESREYIDPASSGALALTAPKVTLHVYLGLAPIAEYAVTSNGLGGYNAAIEREFVWGARYPEPVAMVDHTDAGAVAAGTPEVLHYLNDVLGSVVALTNAVGVPVERYEYDPYGTTYIEWRIPPTGWHFTDAQGQPYATSRYGNPFMWTGQRFDPTTGQYHFWARTYSPRLGRWLQRDPLEYVDGVSLYTAVVSRPTSNTDPLGLWYSPANPFEEYRWPHAGEGQTISQADQYWFSAGVMAGLPKGAWNFVKDFVYVLSHPWEIKRGIDEFLHVVANYDLGDVLAASLGMATSALDHFAELSPYDQGVIVGRLLGEFGAGILTGEGVIKAIEKLRGLKEARRIAELAEAARRAAQASKEFAAARIPNLAGRGLAEAERILKESGFSFRSRTIGGYRKYVHDDGSVIWVGPDGAVKRLGPKTPGKGRPRYGPDGEEIPFAPGSNTHDTGECV